MASMEHLRIDRLQLHKKRRSNKIRKMSRQSYKPI